MNSQSDVFDNLSSHNSYGDFSFSEQEPSKDEYFGGDIFEKISKEKKDDDSFGFLETAKDITEQALSKGISGAVGSYGNIAESFGLQLPLGRNLPGQDVRNKLQSDTLEKLNRGDVPSLGELMSLSEDETPRLPTSREFQKGIEAVTGVGEGKTPLGRIAGRGAEFVGEGLATGGGTKALVGLGLSGLSGQGVRELGGPEGLATGIEIGGTFVPSIASKALIPTGKVAKDIVEAGKKVGLTEAQITPLMQGEKKVATLSKVARKGTKTKNLFASIKESLGDSYSNIKKSVSNIKTVGPQNNRILIDRFTDIKNDLQKTLKASPDKEAAIKFISDSIDKIVANGSTPEELINFWQDINKSVKWGSIEGGKKSLARLKEPILEVIGNIAPEAAKDFEMTNQLYTKYSQIRKSLKPDIIESVLSKAEILAVPGAGIALATGNPSILIGLASEGAIRTLAREMLINPYFQNVSKKLVTNFNQSSLKGLTTSVNQVREYMERKHPNEDWSFLTEDSDQS